MLARHSGLIFSGIAIRVEYLNREPDSGVATTQITFRVQTAIRGVRRGQVIQIREWDGLWNCGEQYRAGERVLLFLYPTSRLGLASPVGGHWEDSGLCRFVHAGGPEFVAGASYFDPTTKGTPLTWARGAVTYYTDQGNLSAILPGPSADSFVSSALSRPGQSLARCDEVGADGLLSEGAAEGIAT